MTRRMTLAFLALCLSIPIMLAAAENLRLNPRLDYASDSHDGPLITGDHLEDGAVARQAELCVHVWGRLIQFQAAGSPLRKPIRQIQRSSQLRDHRPGSEAFARPAAVGGKILQWLHTARCHLGFIRKGSLRFCRRGR